MVESKYNALRCNSKFKERLPVTRRGTRLLFAVSCSAAFILYGCSKSAPVPSGQPDGAEDDKARIPIDELKEMADGHNRFAFDLYKSMANSSVTNLIISPYCISSSLAPCYAAARGSTAKELRDAIGFNSEAAQSLRLYAAYSRWMRAGAGGATKCRLIQSLWVQEGIKLTTSYEGLFSGEGGIPIQRTDFANDPENARKRINQWIEDSTERAVPALLESGDVRSDTRALSVSATRFNGEWKTPFDPRITYEEEFWTDAVKKSKAPMMRADKATLRFYQNKTWQVVELPYSGDRLSMVVLVPATRFGLGHAEAGLSNDVFRQLIGRLDETKVMLHLPRFKYSSRNDVTPHLAKMGLSEALSDKGDFSGFTGGRGTRIGGIVHCGVIEVDERGTTVATASGGVARVSAPPFIKADHPFMFVIRDSATGMILYMGRVLSI